MSQMEREASVAMFGHEQRTTIHDAHRRMVAEWLVGVAQESTLDVVYEIVRMGTHDGSVARGATEVSVRSAVETTWRGWL